MADATKRLRNMSTALTSWVQTQIAGDVVCPGDIFFLVPSASSTAQFKTWLENNGVDSLHYSTSFATISARMKNGRNDVLIVLPGSHTISAAITWSNSYCHIIGACSPVPVNQRSRLTCTSNAITPLFTLSGSGCVIKNIMLDHQGTHASTAAVVLNISGARNYLENVTCRQIGALTIAGNAYRALVLASSNGENYFKKCTFGADTVDAGTATNYVLEFNGANQTARNIWDECLFLGNGSANQCFILATTISSLSSVNIFKRCVFYNNDNGDLDAMTQAFNLNASAGGQIILMDCLVYGASAYESTNSGLLYGRHSYAAATTDVAVALTY